MNNSRLGLLAFPLVAFFWFERALAQSGDSPPEASFPDVTAPDDSSEDATEDGSEDTQPATSSDAPASEEAAPPQGAPPDGGAGPSSEATPEAQTAPAEVPVKPTDPVAGDTPAAPDAAESESPYEYPLYAPSYAEPAPVLPYKEGMAIPPGYRLESRMLRGPIIAGASMAGSTYLINFLVGTALSAEGDDRATLVLLPGIGTWALVPEVCEASGEGCEFLVVHSLVHTAGVGLLIAGLVARKKRLVRDYAGIQVTPVVSHAGAGVVLRGSF